MRAVVWYSSWQMQCCGERFTVGDDIAFTVDENIDDEWFCSALGREVAATITHSEEHHSDGERMAKVEGRVVTITGAWCAFGPKEPNDRIHVPIEGSARFAKVREAGAVDHDEFPDLNFNGWLVELA